MQGLHYAALSAALQKIRQEGRGALAELSRQSGVSESVLGRLTDRKQKTVTLETWGRMLPSIFLRQVPVTAAICLLLWRRLDRLQIAQAAMLVGLFWACRAFYIVVLMHLSREQLYLNWRNAGEAIHYAFFVGALLLFLPVLLRIQTVRGKEPSKDNAPPNPAAR